MSRNDGDIDELVLPAGLKLRVDAACELLEELRDAPEELAKLSLEDRERLVRSAGRFAQPSRAQRKRVNQATRRNARKERKNVDEAVLSKTAIRRMRAQAVFQTPLPSAAPAALPAPGDDEPLRVHKARTCYICKDSYDVLHSFYDQLCPKCGDQNFARRNPQADLTGRRALVTGARVKIGFQAATMLLRAGAHVIITTRFPHDAAARYANETDFDVWQHRLEIHGLDLRHTPSVEAFCTHLCATQPHLDYLINNACQTVRKPPEFYSHLMALERSPAEALPTPHQQLLGAHRALNAEGVARGPGETAMSVAASERVGSAELSQLALLEEDELSPELSAHIFPKGRLDVDLQQVDLRERNSWRLPLADVSSVELIETQLVNAIAPFVLNARLKPLMLRMSTRDRHIVNVSAVEGQFYRSFKTDKHPHTNMAKAALNMMTRTSAADYIKDGIHMNSVDTGWVTDEDPADIARRKTEERGFHPPLDIIDGAARIVAPIFESARDGERLWGQFLKDYVPVAW